MDDEIRRMEQFSRDMRTMSKEILELPREHYVATVTPLGIPAEVPAAPARKPASELVRWL